jgi:hypothetical protein
MNASSFIENLISFELMVQYNTIISSHPCCSNNHLRLLSSYCIIWVLGMVQHRNGHPAHGLVRLEYWPITGSLKWRSFFQCRTLIWLISYVWYDYVKTLACNGWIQQQGERSFMYKLVWVIFMNPVPTSKRTPHFTITNIYVLMLFKEIIAVYKENHMKPINTKCTYRLLKKDEHIVTVGI